MEDLWGEWDRFEIGIGEVVERRDRLLYPVSIQGRGRTSGAPIDSEIFHLTTMRDGLIVRHALEAT